MSDSLSWIDNADRKRIRELAARSAELIAAVRRDLEMQRLSFDRQGSTNFEGPALNSRAGVCRDTASAQRRALFRKLLRSPELGAALSAGRPPCLGLEDRGAEGARTLTGYKPLSERKNVAKLGLTRRAPRHSLRHTQKGHSGRERQASRY